jgi:hypothetical protein
MYNEGSVILYSENTFAFRIWEDRGVGYAPFLKADHIKNSERRGVPIKKIKKYTILVQLQDEDEFYAVRSSVDAACRTLAKTLGLQQLDISLQLDRGVRSCNRVLQPFASLRGLRSVAFRGIPPRYAKYLESKMISSASQDQVHGMFDVLQDLAGHFKFCDSDLENAWDAIEDVNVKRFKKLRLEIIKKIDVKWLFIMNICMIMIVKK